MLVRTFGQEEFRRLGVKFKTAANGKELRRNLTRRLQAEVGKPAVRAVQLAVRGIRVKGVKGHGSARRELSHRLNRPRSRLQGFGLRQAVARTVKSRIKYSGKTVGIRIFSDPRSMPGRQRNLPRHLDNPRGWRHPVWGNRDRWVRQVGQPYWDKTLRTMTRHAQAAVKAAVNDTLKELR